MEQGGAVSKEPGKALIGVQETLELVRWLGEQLQTIPKDKRHNVIAALQNKRSAFVKEHGENVVSQVIDAFIDGWTDFPESKSYVGRKKP
ncbi:hypothetical protein ACI2VR_19420 [Ralstonia nicotianae]